MHDFLWWRDGIIYQIYPRSFADSNGDGIGDLAGITAHLDHLAGSPDALGVDAIWISPVYPSPGHDFGYDISDYEDIDPMFGNMADFHTLVAECHQRGIRVIMDLVMNHTSHQHPWFKASRSSRDNPKRDWYLWADARPGAQPPNNWQAVFGGSAWEWDEATQQYYHHKFLAEQPDLNWRNPDVREAMFKMMRFWLEAGVDGFRLDVVNNFFKDERLRDNPFKLGLRAFDRQQHVYDQDRPEMAELLQALRTFLDGYAERMAVGEVMGQEAELAMRYLGDGSDQLHQAFNFEFTAMGWKPAALQKAIQRTEATCPPKGWPCYVLSNHDVDRHATRFGGGPRSDARCKVAAALLLTQRGTPYLYYGEEIGLLNTRIPFIEIQDPPGKRYWPFYKGRDPARTPMPWDSSPQAGFSSAKPWLRLNEDFEQRNVAAQKQDPNSLFHFYRKLIALRKSSPALLRGRWFPLLPQPRHAMAYLRQCEEQTLLVGLNFTDRALEVELSAAFPPFPFRLLLSSAPGEGRRLNDRVLTLAPFEAVILERE